MNEGIETANWLDTLCVIGWIDVPFVVGTTETDVYTWINRAFDEKRIVASSYVLDTDRRVSRLMIRPDFTNITQFAVGQRD